MGRTPSELHRPRRLGRVCGLRCACRLVRRVPGGGAVRRSTVYTIILGCYTVVLAVLAASLWLNDERLAVIGLLAFTGLCIVSAFLITLNEH